jgi:hypothetical protein
MLADEACENQAVKRMFLVTLLIVVIGHVFTSSGPASAESSTLPRCSTASVRVDEYSFQGGAGNLNYLFRIARTGSRACSLHGYVHVSFVGTYGLKPEPLTKVRTLAVKQSLNRGMDGNDIGGLAPGIEMPTVSLSSAGSAASFWLYGNDAATSGPNGVALRCISSSEMRLRLPGDAKSLTVHMAPGQDFNFCGTVNVHPIVPGSSGSDPAKKLLFHFN